jgi:hypothetical protein
VLSGTFGFEQDPVLESQAPATWHWSRAVQVIGDPLWQTPDRQASPWVQAFPSLQEMPSVA